MEQWEYKLVPTETMKAFHNHEVEMFLDKFGDYGWELCEMDFRCFIFKRKKTNG